MPLFPAGATKIRLRNPDKGECLYRRTGTKTQRDSWHPRGRPAVCTYEAYQRLFTSILEPMVSYYNVYHALLMKPSKETCLKRPLCETFCIRDLCAPLEWRVSAWLDCLPVYPGVAVADVPVEDEPVQQELPARYILAEFHPRPDESLGKPHHRRRD